MSDATLNAAVCAGLGLEPGLEYGVEASSSIGASRLMMGLSSS